MASISVADIKKLREETGAGMLDCKKALIEAGGELAAAKDLLRKRNLVKAAKKEDRETAEGYIAHYVHTNHQVAALVEILCETDFVARNEEFQSMAREVAMQVASMNPASVEELMKQDYIRDGQRTIEDLVRETSGKIGEKMVVNRFVRYQVGDQA